MVWFVSVSDAWFDGRFQDCWSYWLVLNTYRIDPQFTTCTIANDSIACTLVQGNSHQPLSTSSCRHFSLSHTSISSATFRPLTSQPNRISNTGWTSSSSPLQCLAHLPPSLGWDNVRLLSILAGWLSLCTLFSIHASLLSSPFKNAYVRRFFGHTWHQMMRTLQLPYTAFQVRKQFWMSYVNLLLG